VVGRRRIEKEGRKKGRKDGDRVTQQISVLRCAVMCFVAVFSWWGKQYDYCIIVGEAKEGGGEKRLK